MQSAFQAVFTFVLLYKYAAIFLLAFFGAVSLPIPSGTVLAASFFFAAQGYLSTTLVFASGLAGTVAGDLAGFLIARAFGRTLLHRLGLERVLASSAVKAIEARIERHPVVTVFLSRFTTTVAPFVNVLGGLTDMAILTFIIVDVVGETGEVVLNYAYGTLFGDNWAEISRIAGAVGALAGVAVLFGTALLWRRLARRRNGDARPL